MLWHLSHQGLVQGSIKHHPAAVANAPIERQRPPRTCLTCKASIREKKDPSQFKDMDEARQYLHSQASWSVAGLLDLLSNSAFGAAKGDTCFGKLYRQLLQYGDQGADNSSSNANIAGSPAAACPDVVASLAVLMLVSEHRVQQMAQKHPQVLSIPLDHVAQRLLLLKQLLPDCDVARMVELQPLLLLRCERQYLVDVVKPRLQALAEGLPGADIAEMMQDDPRLLFEELESSLPRLRELWPSRLLDDSAFAASEPWELGLALRAMSDQGPPRRY